MTRALLDVKVLLALFDADHVDHQRARDWLDSDIEHGWASCAITENGFVRIVSQPRYPSPISPYDAIERLDRATRTAHHERWPCTLSLLDDDVIDRKRLHGHRQITDAYLLAVAVANSGRFATFDARVPLNAVRDAETAHLLVI